jgi:quercetin dioxygenase-like cupin family protein
MIISSVDKMFKGWFIGNFEPSLLKTDQFEIACKYYQKGDYEDSHVHKIGTEYTVIAQGTVEMNGIQYKKGDIIIIEPNEYTDFKVLEDNTITIVVKVPCVKGDKYIKE